MVLGALSTPPTRDFNLTVELRDALKLQSSLRLSPYVKAAPEIKEFTKGLKTMKVPEQLSINEAASLFEVYMKKGALHTGEY